MHPKGRLSFWGEGNGLITTGYCRKECTPKSQIVHGSGGRGELRPLDHYWILYKNNAPKSRKSFKAGLWIVGKENGMFCMRRREKGEKSRRGERIIHLFLNYKKKYFSKDYIRVFFPNLLQSY